MGFSESFERGLFKGSDAYFNWKNSERADAQDRRLQETHDIETPGRRTDAARKRQQYESDQSEIERLRGMPGPSAPQAAPMQSGPMPNTPMVDGSGGMPPQRTPMMDGGAQAPAPAPATGLAGPGAPTPDVWGEREAAARAARIRALQGGDTKEIGDAEAKAAALRFERSLATRLKANKSLKRNELLEWAGGITGEGSGPFGEFNAAPTKNGGWLLWRDGQRSQALTMTDDEFRLAKSYAELQDEFPQEAGKAMSAFGEKIRSVRKDNAELTDKVANTNSQLGLRGAQTGYYGEQTRALADQRGRREEAASLQARWDALTPEQQNGPEGRALERQFNMLNIKNGAAVPLGGGRGGAGDSLLRRKVEQKKNDDGTYTAFDAATGVALYNTHNGQVLPLGATVPEVMKLREAAAQAGVEVMPVENNGRIVFGYVGPSGEIMPSLEAARRSQPKAASRAVPAPSQGVTPSQNSRMSSQPAIQPNPQRGAGLAPLRQQDLPTRQQIYGSAPGR